MIYITLKQRSYKYTPQFEDWFSLTINATCETSKRPLKAMEILSIQTRETRMIDLKKLRILQQKDTNYCSPQPVLTKFLQTRVEVQTSDSYINIHTCEHLKLVMTDLTSRTIKTQCSGSSSVYVPDLPPSHFSRRQKRNLIIVTLHSKHFKGLAILLSNIN